MSGKINPRTKGNARPILGKRAAAGLIPLVDAIPSSLFLADPNLAAAARWIKDYAEWHASPRATAKRKARGASIKQWELSQ